MIPGTVATLHHWWHLGPAWWSLVPEVVPGDPWHCDHPGELAFLSLLSLCHHLVSVIYELYSGSESDIWGIFRLKCAIYPDFPCTEADSYIPCSQTSSKALRCHSQYGHFSHKKYIIPIINLILCNPQMKLFEESKTSALEQLNKKLLLYLAAPEENAGEVPRAPESAGGWSCCFHEPANCWGLLPVSDENSEVYRPCIAEFCTSLACSRRNNPDRW